MFEVYWVALLQHQNLRYTIIHIQETCKWQTLFVDCWVSRPAEKWEVKSFRVEGISYHVRSSEIYWNLTLPKLAMFERKYICQTIILGVFFCVFFFGVCVCRYTISTGKLINYINMIRFWPVILDIPSVKFGGHDRWQLLKFEMPQYSNDKLTGVACKEDTRVPSRKLTYPHLGKRNSIFKGEYVGDMLVPWRVYLGLLTPFPVIVLVLVWYLLFFTPN